MSHSPTFSEIVNKVDQLAKLNRIVHQKLDPELKNHCRVANFRDGIVIITCNSPALGNLLRYAEMDLLSALREEPEWCHIKAVKSHVRPTIPLIAAPPSPTLPKPTLSNYGREMLKNTAQSISSPSLQQALERLIGK